MSYAKFVVLTTSRTGSTWLIDLLNRYPGVESHGELFLRRPRLRPAIAGRSDYPRFIEAYGNAGPLRLVRVVSYLNTLFKGRHTVGFKLMYTQLRAYPELLAYSAVRRIRIVHLTRRNLLDVLVSEQLAMLTGSSHILIGTNSAMPRVHLDPKTLIERIRRLDRNAKRVRWLIRLSTCAVLEVTYEEMLNGDKEFKRVLEFLDLTPSTARVESTLAKRGTRSHREAIANYDEVREVLAPTSFMDMLQ